MLNFRLLTIATFGAFLTLGILRFLSCDYHWPSGFFCSYSFFIQAVLIALYLGVSVIMAFNIRSQFHHRALCSATTREKVCALTFDDGPHEIHTPEVFTELNRYGVPAVFFCIGRLCEKNPDILREMHRQGHIIGNHSWSHSGWIDFLPSRLIRSELIRTSSLIRTVTGLEPRLFRPPFGVINPMVSRALKGLDWDVIGWNIRSLDTIARTPARITDKILRNIRPGSVILLHDHLPQTAAVVKELIPALRQRGYELVSLPALLNIHPYA
jgi:peptidoglycan/xylan/chitin deacetylase (PgdA/CDA1 family)